MKKNGFTLIELLAVIVILAIIALIATPIILGIVEDAKKDSFARSVELVVSATDLDVMSKLTDSGYEYELIDGKIVYDKEGKETYAVHNEKYCVLKMKNGMQKIITYEEGNCEIEEALTNGITFSEVLTQVSTEGSSIISGDGQLINLGRYGIRFQGNNPNNYVTFNNELWRIIGVVDGNIKIVRSKSLEVMSWDDPGNDFDPNDNTTWDGDNNWSDSTLQTYLNGEYYNSMDATSKSMIQASTWYLRGNNTPEVTKYDMYDLERTTGAIYGSNPEKIENTNMGLMYPSDWGLGAMETESCLATTSISNYRVCGPTNWLSSELIEWLITPASSRSDFAFGAAFSLGGGPDVGGSRVLNPFGVRPVLNLISGVRLSDGLGTKEKPYTLSME